MNPQAHALRRKLVRLQECGVELRRMRDDFADDQRLVDDIETVIQRFDIKMDQAFREFDALEQK